jgi:hypothetical protein
MTGYALDTAAVLLRGVGGRAQLQALADRGRQRLGPAQRNSARRLREIGREAVQTADEIRELLD